MEEKKPKKRKQTSPLTAGINYIPDNFDDVHKKDEGGQLMRDLIPLFEKAWGETRRGCNWTPIELQEEILNYFKYVEEKQLKPAKAGLRLWLGVGMWMYNEWAKRPEKYGAISDLINSANAIMEMQYINRAEKYPTANLFLLKTQHQYVETTKVDITSNNTVSENDIQDVVKQLGLDKTNE